ncbi:MAG: hypothetical protein LBD63_00530 [Mycoplasmataceae bacterium]|nr:hypothetical protein [Mycoplasmataceae bacterium]
MSELKTETVVVSGTNKVRFSSPSSTINLTKHQTSIVQLESQVEVPKTIKQQLETLRENAKDTRKISKINPYASYFPVFYKKELRNAFMIFVIWTVIWFLMLAASAAAIYFIVLDEQCSNYISLLLAPFIVLVTSLWVIATNKFYCFRGESKTINFKDEKTLSINVTKIYKRFKTGYININWMSLTSYIVSLLIILINFIVAWADTHGSVKFGTWDVNQVDSSIKGSYVVYEIIFWVAVATILLTIALQSTLLLTNYIRASRIENFYNFQIVPQEELTLIKKQKNRRDLVIFLCAIALVGIIGFFIYRLVKRSKVTKVVVS